MQLDGVHYGRRTYGLSLNIGATHMASVRSRFSISLNFGVGVLLVIFVPISHSGLFLPFIFCFFIYFF